MKHPPTVYPVLWYRDAPSAMAWLKEAFGFEEMVVIPGENGTIVHAEMSFGEGVIMLGSARLESGWASPLDLPAVCQSIYMVVPDPDAHYERAKAAGAEITIGLETTDYGSRQYSAKDPEGHHWHFGTYQPSAQ
ncbi:MAG: VOC family protein [Chloroflexota bacterium]